MAFRALSAIASLAAVALLSAGCGSAPRGFGEDAATKGTGGSASKGANSQPPGATATVSPPLPANAKALARKKAEMLTSIWENGTTVLQYGYCENIHDGRGFTSGRAGFCTGTGDAVLVARCFDAALGSQSELHKYMGELDALASAFSRTGENQSKTSGLTAKGSYCSDWAAATTGVNSAAFKACQDKVVEDLYYTPSLKLLAKWGLTTALTTAAVYDAYINHGEDGVAALIAAGNAAIGNGAQVAPRKPLSAAEESAWLKGFLQKRLAVMKADTTWAEAVDRVAEYESLRALGNWDLQQTIVTNAKAMKLFPGNGFADSGYPICDIAPDGSVSGDPACTSATGL